MYRKVAIAFLVGVSLASSAFGGDAFVVARSPGVLVNPGDGYMTVKTVREVRAGDQVMANETGQGWIVYCGCDEEIRPNKVYTVEERDCKVESVRLNEPNWPHAVLLGNQREEQELRRCRSGIVPLYVFGAAAATITCGAADCFDNDGKGGVKKAVPVSP